MPTPFSYSDQDLYFHHTIDSAPNPQSFAMHTHDRCELYLFLAGKGTFLIEGSEYPLESGDILVMRPFEAHCIRILPDKPYERMAVHFHPRLIPQQLSDMLLSTFYGREPGNRNLIRVSAEENALLQANLRQMLQNEPSPRENILSHLFPVLYALSAAKKNALDSAEETLPYRIIRYINENLTAPLSLDSICKTFFISKSQLCRLFKQYAGSTVWHYITVKRLLRAKELIDGGAPASRVCGECGFSDYSVFFRAYRKQFGCTPKASEEKRPTLT